LWLICLEASWVLLYLMWGLLRCLVLWSCISELAWYKCTIGSGELFVCTLYMNFAVFRLYSWVKFSSFSCLKRGSVCSLYFEFVMLRIIFFCIIFSLYGCRAYLPRRRFHSPNEVVLAFHKGLLDMTLVTFFDHF